MAAVVNGRGQSVDAVPANRPDIVGVEEGVTYSNMFRPRRWLQALKPTLHEQPMSQFWLDRTRIFLQPIAPPSILGLYGFGAATFVVGAHAARWFGTPLVSPPLLAPFAFFLGGIAQLIAGINTRHTTPTAPCG